MLRQCDRPLFTPPNTLLLSTVVAGFLVDTWTHSYGLHFPGSFATRYGHVTKFLPMEVLERMCLILVSFVVLVSVPGSQWRRDGTLKLGKLRRQL